MRRSPDHSSSPTSSHPPGTSNFRHLRRRNLKRRERRARSKRFPESDGFSLASTFSKRTDPCSTTASSSDPDPSVRSSKYEASSSDRSRSGPYINVVAFPVFHGRSDECPFTHLSRFRKVCGANNAESVEMMMRIFPVTLEDEAALWYDLNIEPCFQSLSLEDIKASFSEAYGKCQDLNECELMLIFQKTDETVRSYMLRFQFLSGNGFSDLELSSVFVEGFSEEIRSFVVGKRPESLCAEAGFFEFEKTKEVRAARKALMESRNARRNVVLNSVEKVASELARCVSMGASSLGLRGCEEEEEGDGKQIGGGLSRQKQKMANECRCSKPQSTSVK